MRPGGILREAKAGTDPLATPERTSARAPCPAHDRAEEALTEFSAFYNKSKHKPWGGKSRLDSHLPADWYARPVATITRGDVNRLLDGLIAGGMAQGANRVRSALSVFFKWAAQREHTERSPVE